MIRAILAHFGYVRVPKATVQLSLMLGGQLKKVRDHLTKQDGQALFDKMIEVNAKLTCFLQSGRMLG